MIAANKMSDSNSVIHHSYGDIIPVFQEDFKKDFDCMDEEKRFRSIFKEKEVDHIIKSKPSKQINILFGILRNKPKEVVEKFVEELLEPNYGFLMSAIKDECRNPSASTKNYIQEVDHLYNNNQRFTKYNVPRAEPHFELQKALQALRPAKNIVVEGVLGSGKRWLVLDVCSSYVIQRKMGFKIFWLNMRNCSNAEGCLEALQKLLHEIDPNLRTNLRLNCDQSVAVRIERVKTGLRHLFKDKTLKNCLLVLLNVKNKETWKAFNLGCKILLTTRHKSVVDYLSPTTTTHIRLRDALTNCEMESLFEKYLSEKPQKFLKDLSTCVATKNPLQLSIIAESIRDGRGTLDHWKHLSTTKLTPIIENSISVLNPHEKQLFETLFIFPESACIPIELLSLVWSVEHPMIIVNRLYEYSLVEKQLDQQNRLTIKLSGIYSELKLTIENESDLHMKIIEFYNIIQVFKRYNDMTLPNLDSYFYSYIGHHLSKISSVCQSVHLFRLIFLDFRFLEQKIRNDTTPWAAQGCILHTLQVLKFYRDKIVDGDLKYKQLLNALLRFLPKIEEKLIRSEYTCLLRIALMTVEGPVYDEAFRQVQQFPDYVWFTEHGRFHHHREIINLGKDEVLHATYLDDDFCLMALSTQQLLLTDVSLEGDTTYLLSDERNPSDIIKMRVFNKQKHLLTLHSNGSLKLWSIPHLHPICYNNGSRQNIKPRKDSKPRCYKQLVNAIKGLSSSNAAQNISAFYLDEKQGENSLTIQLHVAITNGDICICDWKNEEKFERSHTPILKTGQLQIRCFSKVLERFYVICTLNCTLSVWDLRSESKIMDKQDYAPRNDISLDMETYIERHDDGSIYTMLLLIYKLSVWYLKFKHADYNTITTLEPEPLQLSDNPKNTITCGKRSNDGRYLILGTLEGLIVYDLKLSNTVLRSNVSEHILCLDIYDLNDPEICEYIVLCGAKGKHFLYVHTLRNNADSHNPAITWVHHDDEAKETYTRAHLEPSVYLTPLLEMSENGRLFVVDSKARIHQIETESHENTGNNSTYWSTIATPQMARDIHITALCCQNDNAIYAGYNNGKIFNISANREVEQQYISEPIEYLKQLDSQVLVASARYASKTLIIRLSSAELDCVPIDTLYARIFEKKYLLMFSEKGLFCIDLAGRKQVNFEESDDLLVGFDLRDNILYLAFRDSAIKVYELMVTESQLISQRTCSQNIISRGIKYLTASNDGGLLALAFQDGHIELYGYEEHRLHLIYSIKQGHEPCNQMKLRFSPCKQVLVSCAEQFCFWDVKHMRNNQRTSHRRSRRGNQWQSKSEPKEGREEVDASPWTDGFEEKLAVEQPARNYVNPAAKSQAHLWSDKRSNTKLAELLACIKFVGNDARHFYSSADFTQFYVIDDEGVFYYLKLLDVLSVQCRTDVKPQRILRQTEAPLHIDEHDYSQGIDVVGNANLMPEIKQNPTRAKHQADTI